MSAVKSVVLKVFTVQFEKYSKFLAFVENPILGVIMLFEDAAQLDAKLVPS